MCAVEEAEAEEGERECVRGDDGPRRDEAEDGAEEARAGRGEEHEDEEAEVEAD